MAFISTKSNIKNSILAFIRHLVSKRVYKAIEIILTPCCHPVVTSSETVCENGTVTLTLKLSSNINLYSNDNASGRLTILGQVVKSTYTDNGTLTFQFENTGASGDYTATLILFMPTSSDNLTGVYLSTGEFTVSVPSCPII